MVVNKRGEGNLAWKSFKTSMALISSMQLKRCTDIQIIVHFFSMQTPTCEFSSKTNLCLEINSLSFSILNTATAEIIFVIGLIWEVTITSLPWLAATHLWVGVYTHDWRLDTTRRQPGGMREEYRGNTGITETESLCTILCPSSNLHTLLMTNALP